MKSLPLLPFYVWKICSLYSSTVISLQLICFLTQLWETVKLPWLQTFPSSTVHSNAWNDDIIYSGLKQSTADPTPTWHVHHRPQRSRVPGRVVLLKPQRKISHYFRRYMMQFNNWIMLVLVVFCCCKTQFARLETNTNSLLIGDNCVWMLNGFHAHFLWFSLLQKQDAFKRLHESCKS